MTATHVHLTSHMTATHVHLTRMTAHVHLTRMTAHVHLSMTSTHVHLSMTSTHIHVHLICTKACVLISPKATSSSILIHISTILHKHLVIAALPRVSHLPASSLTPVARSPRKVVSSSTVALWTNALMHIAFATGNAHSMTMDCSSSVTFSALSMELDGWNVAIMLVLPLRHLIVTSIPPTLILIVKSIFLPMTVSATSSAHSHVHPTPTTSGHALSTPRIAVAMIAPLPSAVHRNKIVYYYCFILANQNPMKAQQLIAYHHWPCPPQPP